MNSIDITLTAEEIAENWIADRSLPPEQIAWLKTDHAANVHNVGLSAPSIAPGHICTELDLPQGSTWIEVVACLLDAIYGTADAHLAEVQRLWGLDNEKGRGIWGLGDDAEELAIEEEE